MLKRDDFISDPRGAKAFLEGFFNPEDICNELAHQVLAMKWLEGIEIWELLPDRKFYKGMMFYV